jgi:hypothetical protein
LIDRIPHNETSDFKVDEFNTLSIEIAVFSHPVSVLLPISGALIPQFPVGSAFSPSKGWRA